MKSENIQTALGAQDPGRSSAVIVSAHRRVAGGTETNDRLGSFTFDPLRNHSVREHLHPTNSPQLFLTFTYLAEDKALTLLLLQGERDLLHLDSWLLTDTYIITRIADETTVSILVHKEVKTS